MGSVIDSNLVDLGTDDAFANVAITAAAAAIFATATVVFVIVVVDVAAESSGESFAVQMWSKGKQ